MHEHPWWYCTNGVGNFAGGEGRRQRQVAAGQRLAQAQDVRTDRGMLAGEQPASAAKAGGNFIGDQQYLVAVTQLARTTQVLG